MGDIGGMLIVCSRRSRPVLFGRFRTCDGANSLLSPLSSTRVTELRWLLEEPSTLKPSSARDGRRGTGGTEDDRALPGSPLLARRSRMYGELMSGCSPRGNVAESWRVTPDLYLDARDSFERNVATKARAMLVPDTAEEISSVSAEDGLGGRLFFVGRGGGILLLVSALSSADDCTLIFALVELLGILIGEGVGFLEECTALCDASERGPSKMYPGHTHCL